MVNAGLGWTRWWGSWPIIWASVQAVTFLQVIQLLQVVRASRLVPTTCILLPVADNKREGPQWPKATCIVTNTSEVRWSFPDRMGGCFWEWLRLEFDSRPPTRRRPPSPRNGDRDDRVLDVLMDLFSLIRESSWGNDRAWARLKRWCSDVWSSLVLRYGSRWRGWFCTLHFKLDKKRKHQALIHKSLW